MSKVPCGGFKLDENFLGMNENDELSLVGGSEGKAYQQLVTDSNGNTQWEDRLAYEDKIPVNPPVNIVWDGNTEGLVASSQNNFYKVSDDIFTVDEFNQMIVTEKDGTEHNVNEYLDSVIVRNGIISYTDAGPLVATVANAGPNPAGAPDTYPEPGVYFPADGSYTALKWFYSTVIKKLDEKFIPSSVTENFTYFKNQLNNKMDRSHPSGAGTLSLNRQINTKIGDYSVAIGWQGKATGKCSLAEGNNTWAEGDYSHTEGSQTHATGSYSHAEGLTTIATGNFQHVEGKYNMPSDQYLHIAGNGTSNLDQNNAYTLDWNGNGWFAGTVEGTAMIVKSSTSGSSKRFKITVDDSGTITATEVTT